MQTANLIGAQLDYWTARAEGVPAADLEIRPVQRPDPRTPDTICVKKIGPLALMRIDYSTNWALTGPLLLKTGGVDEWWRGGGPNASYWQAPPGYDNDHPSEGDTPLIAICRAVVRAAFGDEVGDLP